MAVDPAMKAIYDSQDSREQGPPLIASRIFGDVAIVGVLKGSESSGVASRSRIDFSHMPVASGGWRQW